MAKRRIVFVGGGTGGHFYPLIAIAEAVTEEATHRGTETPSLYYFGPDPYDIDALKALNITYVYNPAGKRRRYISFLNTLDIFKTIFGIGVALVKLFFIYPDVIMSKGSYTSVPVTLAAWLLRIPIVIHESDVEPGAANKLAGRLARYIAVSYADTMHLFPKEKTVLTGIPMRKTMRTPLTNTAHQELGIEKGRPVLLVLGGSQGAERINELMLESLDELLPTYTIIHQTGRTKHEVVAHSAQQLVPHENLIKHYHSFPFLDAGALNQAMHISSVIISRAGSGSIYEIASHGKPSIIIPIPEEVSHDQRTNAYTYARTGAGTVMEEKNLRDGLLAAEIERIMNDQGMYAAMSEAAYSFVEYYAAEKLALTLIEIGEEH